jgi:hypothetical protein
LTLDNDNTLNTAILNCEKLVPNSFYTVKITVESALSEELAEKILTFTTQQSLPKNVSSVILKNTDKALPYDAFKLEIEPLTSQSWGYWKSNGNGYTIQLIVNGKVRAEKETTYLPKTLAIIDYFNYNKVAVGDTIQIGIRTWVKYNGKPLYNGSFAKCSNPICMLKKPVLAYLNKDKIC